MCVRARMHQHKRLHDASRGMFTTGMPTCHIYPVLVWCCRPVITGSLRSGILEAVKLSQAGRTPHLRRRSFSPPLAVPSTGSYT